MLSGQNSWLGVFENNLVTKCTLVSLNIHALVLFVETCVIQNPISCQMKWGVTSIIPKRNTQCQQQWKSNNGKQIIVGNEGIEAIKGATQFLEIVFDSNL
jgi:hypothetical protein